MFSSYTDSFTIFGIKKIVVYHSIGSNVFDTWYDVCICDNLKKKISAWILRYILENKKIKSIIEFKERIEWKQWINNTWYVCESKKGQIKYLAV